MVKRDESGFTLIELIIVVAVLGIVMSAIAASLIAVITTTGATASRVSQSHDSQLLSTYLVPDLQSATGPAGISYTAPPSGFEVGDCPPSTAAAPPFPAVTWSQMGSLRLSWSDAASGVAYHALYAVDTSDFVLRRASLRQVADAVLSSSTTVTSASAGFLKSDEGSPISGVGIPNNARITQVKSRSEVVISPAATVSSPGIKLTIRSALSATTSRQVTDGDTTSTSPPTVRSATAAFSAHDVGAPLSAPGVPPGTFIVGVKDPTVAYISAGPTAPGSGLTSTVGATATSVVVHNLEDPSSTEPLPPGATHKYPVCYTNIGNRTTLNVNTLVRREGKKGSFQYGFNVSGETRTPFGTPSSTPVPPTMLTALASEDIAPQNGIVDTVVATFNQPVACTGAPSCDKTKWKVTDQPGAALGTIDRITTSANTVALSLQETATVDTAASAMRVELAPGSVAGVGGPASFISTAVLDSMPPRLEKAAFRDDDPANGKIESIALTFSEVLVVIPRKQDYSLADAPLGTAIVDPAPAVDPKPIVVSGRVHTLPVSESTVVDTVAAGMRIRIAGGAGTDGVNASFPGELTVVEGIPPTLNPASPPVLKDIDDDGKAEIVVSFNEALATGYSAPSSVWSFAGEPPGVTLSSVAVAGSQATLTLSPPIPANTSTGFTLALNRHPAGIRDAAGNESSFAPVNVKDGMGPALVSVVTPNNPANISPGKIEPGDMLDITFSEPIATVPTPSLVMVVEDSISTAGTTFTLPGLVTSLIVSGARYTDITLICDVLTSAPSPDVVRLTVDTCVATLTAGSAPATATIDGAARDSAGNPPPSPAPVTSLASAVYF